MTRTDGFDARRRHGFIVFGHPVAVYSDACHRSDGYHPGPVDNRRRARRRAHRAAGMGRRDRPVGHLHRRLRRQSIPTHRPRRHIGLRHQELSSRLSDGTGTHPDSEAGRTTTSSSGGLYEPGETETLWVLDIDGTVVVITRRLCPEASAAARADFAAAVLDSIRIERP